MSFNIYYHFFDRELRQSVGASFTNEQLLEIISVSIFMTDQSFYMPISNLYESYLDYPNSLEHIKKLDKIGLIQPASSHKSVENFLLSRQHLYRHDRERYPMYFDDKNNIWSPNLLILENSTTKILRDKFINKEIEIPEFSESDKDRLDDFIKNIIETNEQKAITFSLFRDALKKEQFPQGEMRLAEMNIRKSISTYYTARYLDAGEGTIVTGISQLKEYDFLAKDEYETNFEIYKYILEKAGVDIHTDDGLDMTLQIRQDATVFPCIYQKLSRFIHIISVLMSKQFLGKKAKLHDYLFTSMNFQKISNGVELLKNILDYIDSICSRCADVKTEMTKVNDTRKSIVILAVTNIEIKELFSAIAKYCPMVSAREIITEDLVYKELVGCKLPVFVVQSQMGATGAGSIINVMHNVYNKLNPGKVIMGGIAFGSDKNKQKTGDILISKQVWNYEPAKIKPFNTISRGDKYPASASLIQLFQSSASQYDEAEIRFGLFASGEKLVNSKNFLRKLKSQEPEIIGGEMEAAGLASVCIEKRIEWLVVKAICDWGYKKDDDGQQLAAHNAFDFIMYTLKKIIIY
jgi:nucleoside phosphorylase